VLKGWISALGARCVLGFLFFFAFFMGCWIAGAGLHDPDTCWLLAMGKFIFETGSIPSADPFSYSFGSLTANGGTVDFEALLGSGKTGAPRVFVPYQWLTEVIFYLAYKIGAGYALLILVDCVLVTGLLAGPLMFFRSLRSPMLPGVLLTILAVVAASFHFLARPEIFSYLFFLVMLGLVVRFRLKLENNTPFQKKDLVAMISPALLMVVWANMHTGFMSIFIWLCAFCVITSVEVLCRPKVAKSVLALPWILFGTLVVASMLNPFGPALWRYVPELFFSPLNRYINELSSIKLSHLTEFTFYPYFILAIVVLVMLAKVVSIWKRNQSFPIGWSFSVSITIGVIIAGICCMRLIPFVAIALLAEVAWLLKGYTRQATEGGDLDYTHSFMKPGQSVTVSSSAGPAIEPGQPEADVPKSSEGVEASASHVSAFNLSASAPPVVPATVNERVTGFLNYGPWPGILLALSLFGVFMISTRVVEPRIPQGSGAFPAPYAAMRFLAQALPAGRVLNDAQLGDMMIWYLIAQEKPIMTKDPYQGPAVVSKPKVFIDTRFDMYGAALVGDYYVMRNAKPGWQQLFERYKFDWVFLPTRANLVKELSRLPDWSEVYREDAAVIFVRKK
jgi:hypothetical protein